MSNWNRVFKPIVVLVVICIIVTGALAATNKVTKPIIDEAIRVAQEQARKELLPDADNFTKVEGVEVENVSDIYTADNGTGTVITCSGKGYGGSITVMVAFSPDDTVKQIKITESSETKGIGTNVTENTEYWALYNGLPATQALVLGTDVDAYTGATISSRAVNNAVNAAIEAYNAIA